MGMADGPRQAGVLTGLARLPYAGRVDSYGFFCFKSVTIVYLYISVKLVRDHILSKEETAAVGMLDWNALSNW